MITAATLRVHHSSKPVWMMVPFDLSDLVSQHSLDSQVMMSQYARELVRRSCLNDDNIVKVSLFRREGMTA
jgi:hypothetical protein